MSDSLKTNFLSALLHFLYNFFVYFLFIVPFDLWKKAVQRLASQRSTGTINIDKIESQWPFLSFLKSFLIDFLIDGIILMSYVLGLIGAVVGLINEGFSAFLGALVGAYFAPLALSLTRDLLQLMILPFKKFLSWIKKPAQYMDLTIQNK